MPSGGHLGPFHARTQPPLTQDVWRMGKLLLSVLAAGIVIASFW